MDIKHEYLLDRISEQIWEIEHEIIKWRDIYWICLGILIFIISGEAMRFLIIFIVFTGLMMKELSYTKAQQRREQLREKLKKDRELFEKKLKKDLKAIDEEIGSLGKKGSSDINE